MSILIIAAIVLAVVLGYKTKINTGFFCIAFAYIIGCFMLGMKTKDLIAEWPTSTMFVILAVSLFYNFAAVNGTLEKMSSSLLYACRRFPGMLPYALFLVAVSWAIFAVEDFSQLGLYLGAMFGVAGGGAFDGAFFYYLRSYLPTLVLACAASTPLAAGLWRRLPERVWKAALPVLLLCVLLLSTAYLVDATYNPFLYFRF